MIYEMCANFANEQLIPHAGEWDKKHEYPTNAIAQLVCMNDFSEDDHLEFELAFYSYA